MAEVVVRISGEESARHPLGNRPLTLGRSPSCDIVLDYPFISKRHAEIVPQVFIRDLGSANGVWLGEQPVEQLPAEPGGRYSISRHQGVEIEIDFGKAAGPPVAPTGQPGVVTTAGLPQGAKRKELERQVAELTREKSVLETEAKALKGERDRLKKQVNQLLTTDPAATFVDPPAGASVKKPGSAKVKHASPPVPPPRSGLDEDPEATFVDRPVSEDAEATFVDRPVDKGAKAEVDEDDSGGTFVDSPPSGVHADDLREREQLELRLASQRAEELRLRGELEKAERLCEAQQQDLEQLRRSGGGAPIGNPDENFMRQLLVALEDVDERNRLSENQPKRERLPEDIVFAVSRFYQFGRAIEKVVTRMAQVYRSRLAGDLTMLPGMHTNWRRSLRRLLEKGEASSRQDLDAYIEELRLWVLACLTAYQKGATSWLEDLFGHISPRAIEREVEAAAWRKKLGWDASQYWARYRELMEEYTHDLCIDQLEEAAARVAVEMAER